MINEVKLCPHHLGVITKQCSCTTIANRGMAAKTLTEPVHKGVFDTYIVYFIQDDPIPEISKIVSSSIIDYSFPLLYLFPSPFYFDRAGFRHVGLQSCIVQKAYTSAVIDHLMPLLPGPNQGLIGKVGGMSSNLVLPSLNIHSVWYQYQETLRLVVETVVANQVKEQPAFSYSAVQIEQKFFQVHPQGKAG